MILQALRTSEASVRSLSVKIRNPAKLLGFWIFSLFGLKINSLIPDLKKPPPSLTLNIGHYSKETFYLAYLHILVDRFI